MNAFAKILKELMNEKPIDAKTLAKQLELSEASIIYRWLKCEISLLLPTAVRIADFFNCSLDYLFGRSDDYSKISYKECPPFYMQLRKVLEEQKISQYRLTKDKIVSGGNFDSWLNKRQIPHIESIIRLADYLQVSMDYLVGRES